MNDFRELSDYYDRHLIEDEEFCVHGYPEKMQMEFAYEDGVVKESEETVVEGIFPTFDYAEGGKDFLFLPLHFREHTVGYFVIRNAVISDGEAVSVPGYQRADVCDGESA